MNVTRYSESGVELEVNGETLRATRRVDRYVEPGKWLRPSEYVEIWCLEDGREVRISCMGNAQTWTARYR
ncbi:hypothetical protein SAMN00790413_03823 [Deinococcus hopiensis KR-140]|uniref:Uncharacterized protein n=1 Tax=Deinococcus hopiensis KR-140 TaxID=695939 RepID=A0A1W1V0D0_9DEIO|nr:hypothetical protein SAMN00790413_03823 [Deinococcus hopiensis KR-140]